MLEYTCTHVDFSLEGRAYLLGRIGLEVTFTCEFQDPGRGYRSPGSDRPGLVLGLPPTDLVPPAEREAMTVISSLELRRGRVLNSVLPDCCRAKATAACGPSRANSTHD